MGGTGVDYAYSVTQTTDEGFGVAGWTGSFGAGGYDFLVFKLNPNGSLAWAKTFGWTGVDDAWSITQTTGGGYGVVGRTTSLDVDGSNDFLVLNLNSDGSLAWARVLYGTNQDYAQSITRAMDGNYVIAGFTDSYGIGNWDCLVLKLGSDGYYPGCVQNCFPTVTNPSLSTTTPPIGGATCSPSTSSPSLTVITPTLVMTNVCDPVYENVDEISPLPQPQITYSLVPGGALFFSSADMEIRIYSADGRLVYSGELSRGKNRVKLESGVYLWKAETYKGKAIVR